VIAAPPQTLVATSTLPCTTAIVLTTRRGRHRRPKACTEHRREFVVFVSLIALSNWPLAAMSIQPSTEVFRIEHGIPVLTFPHIVSVAPIAWCLGSERDWLINSTSGQMTAQAPCGFANNLSIAIQIGGLSAMARNRRADAASPGLAP